MSAHRLRLLVVASVCALGALHALSSVAFAGQEHVFIHAFGELPAYENNRVGPETAATDESTGDVYAADFNHRCCDAQVYKFDGAGEPAQFSALGNNILAFPAENEPYLNLERVGIAVDNSAGPNKGDIYAAALRGVFIYGPDGSLLGSLHGSAGEPWGYPCGVTVDPSGAVYVAVGSRVDRFVPGVTQLSDDDFVSSLPLPEVTQCNLAADSKGAVYVTNVGSYGQRYGGPVEKYDALQFGSLSPVGTVIDASAKAVAVDPATDHVYTQKTVGEGSEIVEYDQFGVQVDAFGEDQLTNGTVTGLAVDPSNDRLYALVVHDVNGKTVGAMEAFTEKRLPMPDVSVGAPSNITETGVTLNATVNPLGLDAKCSVEYGPEASYGNTVPCEPEDVGSGSTPVAVSAKPGGVEAGVQYHYRFVLSNENGSKSTTDRIFAPASKPIVGGSSVESTSVNGATVTATINPRYYGTNYHFEYGTDTSYGSSSPSPDSPVGAGGSDKRVVWSLSGLQAGATYHVRVAATNQFGTVRGPDMRLTTFASPSGGGSSCSNTAIRQAQNSTYLPDCRAIEMVSPPSKGSSSIATDATKDQASPDGEAVKYWSAQGFGEVAGSEVPGAEYISRRGSDGWSTRSITPPATISPPTTGQTSVYAYLAPDLSKGVFYSVVPVLPGHPNVANVPSLYTGTGLLGEAPEEFALVSDAFQPIPYIQTDLSKKIIDLGGVSTDLSHVVFEAPYDLTPETSSLRTDLPKVYESVDSVVRLAGVLPNGEPASESRVGDGVSHKVLTNPVSADGSRVVFEGGHLSTPHATEGHFAGALYMRIDGIETVMLNASERSEPQVSQPAQFAGATPDDSEIFFFSAEALTDDASTGSYLKLYRYELDAPTGKHLTLISADSESSDNNDADTDQSEVVGMSTDGHYLYFIMQQKLVPGQPSTERGRSYWLYLWHDGELRVLGEHTISADGTWGEGTAFFVTSSFRVTPDGRHAVFVSGMPYSARRAGLTANPDSLGEVKREVYAYDYEGDRLVCASCRPGVDVSADSGDVKVEETADASAAGNLGTNSGRVWRHNRWVTDDGRYVFFDSNEALLPQASNGHWNVYEYDTATDGLYMISTGTCDCNSYLIETTPNGSDLFFTTHQRLVRSDIDTNGDLYDARIQGGIARQNEPVALPCTGESCQTAAEGPPTISTPASATFAGLGNVVQPAVKSVVGARSLTRAQKLARALKSCHRRPKRARPKCEASARKRYKAKGSTRSASRRAGR